MEMAFKSHARIDSCTQSWFRYDMKRKKNTDGQMGHTKKKYFKKEQFNG